MFTANSPIALRKVLLLDAATSAVMGAVLVVDASTIAAWTAIASAFLWYVGVLLLPLAAFMAVVATRALSFGAAVRLIIVGNELWVAASLVLMFGPWIAPNALGYAFIGAQALVVALLAAAEYGALRRASLPVAA